MTEQEQVIDDYWKKALAGEVDRMLSPLRSELVALRGEVDRLKSRGVGAVNYLDVPTFAGAETVGGTGDVAEWRGSD